MNTYAIYKTNIGYIKISYEDNILIGLKIISVDINDFGKRTEFSDDVFNQFSQYLIGERKSFNIPFIIKGTPFEKKVYKALCDIPYGQTKSYKDIAISINNEKAYRAVGMANNKNPIAIIIPCHRVIGVSGKLVGYAAGLSIKEQLLNLEKENK